MGSYMERGDMIISMEIGMMDNSKMIFTKGMAFIIMLQDNTMKDISKMENSKVQELTTSQMEINTKAALNEKKSMAKASITLLRGRNL